MKLRPMNYNIQETRTFVKLKYRLCQHANLETIFDALPSKIIDYMRQTIQTKHNLPNLNLEPCDFRLYILTRDELENILVEYHLDNTGTP